MNKDNLTKKQQKVFEIISDYYSKNGHAPTISELCSALDVKSSRTVTQYLELLERKGFIRRDKYSKRGIVPVKKEIYTNPSIVQFPVLGYAGCDNQSILANPIYDEYISVSKEILKNRKGQVMAIMAIGSSMSAAGIDSGDIVLVEKTEQIKNNDRVLAVIDEIAVIKRIIFADNSVILNPDSKEDGHKPIVMQKDFKVVGKVVDVIKKQNDGNKREEEIIPIRD